MIGKLFILQNPLIIFILYFKIFFVLQYNMELRALVGSSKKTSQRDLGLDAVTSSKKGLIIPNQNNFSAEIRTQVNAGSQENLMGSYLNNDKNVKVVKNQQSHESGLSSSNPRAKSGKKCSRNHDAQPNQRWAKTSHENSQGRKNIQGYGQEQKLLLNIQTDGNELSQAQGSLALADHIQEVREGVVNESISPFGVVTTGSGIPMMEKPLTEITQGQSREISKISGAQGDQTVLINEFNQTPTAEHSIELKGGETSLAHPKNSTSYFQNQALIQGLRDPSAGDGVTNSQAYSETNMAVPSDNTGPTSQGGLPANSEQYTRNKRQVFSKESNKLPGPIGLGNQEEQPLDSLPHNEDASPINGENDFAYIESKSMEQDQVKESDFNERQRLIMAINGAQHGRLKHNFDQQNIHVPGTKLEMDTLNENAPTHENKTFDYTTQDIKNELQYFENLEMQQQMASFNTSEVTHDKTSEYLADQAKKNPNIVLDHYQVFMPALIDILENQKQFIQKDGIQNLMLNGILIKGAPSLGTKFNPNFRDPHHTPQGKRPQSRGLTQGNIIQIASKMLAVMNSPQTIKQMQKHQKNAFDVSQSLQETDKINEIKNESGTLMMQGTKKQTMKKKILDKPKFSMPQQPDEDTVKSMSSQLTKNGRVIAEKKIIKIQGGGEHGQDKVQLNVKFTQNSNGHKFFSQSQFNQSNYSASHSPMRLNKIQSYGKQILMSNDSNYNMSTHHNKDKYAELNSSFQEIDQAGPFMDKLQVFGSTSPTPELRHYTQIKKLQSAAKQGLKDENGLIKVARNSSNNNDLAEYAQTVSRGVGRKTPSGQYQKSETQQNKMSNHMRSSQGVESMTIIKEDIDFTNVASAQNTNMRINLHNLGPDGQKQFVHQRISTQESAVKMGNKGDTELQKTRSKSNKNASGTTMNNKKGSFERLHNIVLQKSKDKQKQIQGYSQRGNSFTPYNVRKGQPIKDFMRQMQGIPEYQKAQGEQDGSPVKFSADVDELKVMSLNTLNKQNFQNFEQSIGLKHQDVNLSPQATSSFNREQQSPQLQSVENPTYAQQHEVGSSKNAVNSALSDDKFKTEKMENTLSPENTGRQDLNSFNTRQVNKEINRANAVNQQMQTVRNIISPQSFPQPGDRHTHGIKKQSLPINPQQKEVPISGECDIRGNVTTGMVTSVNNTKTSRDQITNIQGGSSQAQLRQPQYSGKRVILTTNQQCEDTDRNNKTIIIEVVEQIDHNKRAEEQADHNDHHTEEVMKPKGIDLQQVYPNENDQIRQKKIVHTNPPTLVNSDQQLQMILDQQIEERVTEENAADKRHLITGEASNIEPKTSFFTSVQEASSPNPRDTQPISTNELEVTEEFSGQGLDLDNIIYDNKQTHIIKKQNTYNSSKKKSQVTGLQIKFPADIDNMQYTENSSKANHVDQTQIYNQIHKTNTQVNNSQSPAKNSQSPMRNQDVVAKSGKKDKESMSYNKAYLENNTQMTNQTQIAPKNVTGISSQTPGPADMGNFELKICDLNSKERMLEIDQALENNRMDRNISIFDRKGRYSKNSPLGRNNKSPSSKNSKLQITNLKQSMESSVDENIHHIGQTAFANQTQPITSGNSYGDKVELSHRLTSNRQMMQSKNSKLMSKIVSESVLDCRDIGIGTSGLNPDEIDQFLKNSHDLLQAAIADANNIQNQSKPADNQYRPIQQINVQLLNQNDQFETVSKKSYISQYKSEKTSMFRSDIDREGTAQMTAVVANEETADGANMTNRNMQHLEDPASGGLTQRSFVSGVSQGQQNVRGKARFSQRDDSTIVDGLSMSKIDKQLSNQKKIKKSKYTKQKRKMAKTPHDEDPIRQKQLFDYLVKQRRMIVKSPNPNDQNKVKIGSTMELEPDILCNGNIYTTSYKLKHADPQISPKQLQSLKRTEITRQQKIYKQDVDKPMVLEGKHIDADKDEVKAIFEQVTSQNKLKNKSDEPEEVDDNSKASKMDLQEQLRTLTLEQLQSIHEILSKGGQIFKAIPNQNQQDYYKGGLVYESLQSVGPMTLQQNKNGITGSISPGSLQSDVNLATSNGEGSGNNSYLNQEGIRIMNLPQPGGRRIMIHDQKVIDLMNEIASQSPKSQANLMNNQFMQFKRASQGHDLRQDSSKISAVNHSIGMMHTRDNQGLMTAKLNVHNSIERSSGLSQHDSVSPTIKTHIHGVNASEPYNSESYDQALQNLLLSQQMHKNQGTGITMKQANQINGITQSSITKVDLTNAFNLNFTNQQSMVKSQIISDEQTENQTIYLPTRQNGTAQSGENQNFHPNGAQTQAISQMSHVRMNPEIYNSLIKSHGAENVLRAQKQLSMIYNEGIHVPGEFMPRRAPQKRFESFKIPTQKQIGGHIPTQQELNQYVKMTASVEKSSKLPRSAFAPDQIGSYPNSQLENTQTCEMDNSRSRDRSIGHGEKSISKGPEGGDFMSSAPHGVDTTRLSTILQQEGPPLQGGALQNHLAFSFSKIEQVTQNSHQFQKVFQTKLDAGGTRQSKKQSSRNHKKFNEDLLIGNVDAGKTTQGVDSKFSPERAQLAINERQSTLLMPRPSHTRGRPGEQLDLGKSSLKEPASAALTGTGAKASLQNVHQIATQIQVSRKSQPLVDTSQLTTIQGGNTLDSTLMMQNHRLQEQHRTSQMQGPQGNMITVSGRPKTQSQGATQRLGKKKLVHSDIQQYELYLQLKQMSRLGQQIKNNTDTSQLILDQPKIIQRAPQTTKNENTFFSKVSQQMSNAFSPKGFRRDIETNKHKQSNVVTIPLSTSPEQRDGFNPSNTVTLSRNVSRIASKEVVPHNAVSDTVSFHEKYGAAGTLNATELGHSRSPREYSMVNGAMPRPGSSNVGVENTLYHQSFQPANRMIQQQRYQKQMDKLMAGKPRLNKLNVVTPTGHANVLFLRGGFDGRTQNLTNRSQSKLLETYKETGSRKGDERKITDKSSRDKLIKNFNIKALQLPVNTNGENMADASPLDSGHALQPKQLDKMKTEQDVSRKNSRISNPDSRNGLIAAASNPVAKSATITNKIQTKSQLGKSSSNHHRSSVKVIINKNNSQYLMQQKQQKDVRGSTVIQNPDNGFKPSQLIDVDTFGSNYGSRTGDIIPPTNRSGAFIMFSNQDINNNLSPLSVLNPQFLEFADHQAQSFSVTNKKSVAVRLKQGQSDLKNRIGRNTKNGKSTDKARFTAAQLNGQQRSVLNQSVKPKHMSKLSNQSQNDPLNKTMLYSVKNHQLFHSHKVNQQLKSGAGLPTYVQKRSETNNSKARESFKNHFQTIQPNDAQQSTVFSSAQIDQLIENNRELSSGYNQSKVFGEGEASYHQYQQYRRIMTADNASVPNAVARRRRIHELRQISGQSGGKQNLDFLAHFNSKGREVQPRGANNQPNKKQISKEFMMGVHQTMGNINEKLHRMQDDVISVDKNRTKEFRYQQS